MIEVGVGIDHQRQIRFFGFYVCQQSQKKSQGARALAQTGSDQDRRFTPDQLGDLAGCRLGNGAVFKLVPEYFPRTVGSVTGLVGAAALARETFAA